MEDREIVELFWVRSEQAIRAAEDKYSAYCHAVAQRIVPYREDAEECVQDTLLRAWNAIPPRRPERLAAFLAKITRNVALDRVRLEGRQKRGGGEIASVFEELEPVLAGSEPDPVDSLALRQAINSFLEGLPQRTRVIFLRRYWYFQPAREIAQSLGVSESKVKMTLLRTRNALREHLSRQALWP